MHAALYLLATAGAHLGLPICSYFNRDVECIRRFFIRRFNYESKLYPRFKSTMKEGGDQDGEGFRLDVVVSASGFKKSDQKTLEEVRISTRGLRRNDKR